MVVVVVSVEHMEICVQQQLSDNNNEKEGEEQRSERSGARVGETHTHVHTKRENKLTGQMVGVCLDG